MSEHVFVSPLNEVYLQIDCDKGIARELSDYFTFIVPNQHFNWKVKNGWWDGKIRLFSISNGTLYRGLLYKLEQFCKERDYNIFPHDNLKLTNEFSVEEAKDFISDLKLHAKGKPIEVRDYQLEAFIKSIRYKRRLWLSPTSSGKSLIAYLITRYLRQTNDHGLIIVPTTHLVEQLHNDFIDYSSKNQWDVNNIIQKIYSGFTTEHVKPIAISTWQSLIKQEPEWFLPISFTIGDEAHLFQAKSLKYIMENLVNSEYRIGMTGTLDEAKTHQLVLEGLFGRIKRITTTKEMIQRKQAAPFKIKSLVLRYPESIAKQVAKLDYHKEVAYLLGSEKRNNFIANLALSLEGNTFVMCEKIDKHAKILFQLIKEKAGNRPVYLIYGKVKTDVREEIRQAVNASPNSIVVYSFGTGSTGIDIPNLHNMIFASPFKSVIRNLQSIGRTLRLGTTKDEAILFDIADDLRYKKKENYSMKHFIARTETYRSEGFPFRIYNIQIGK